MLPTLKHRVLAGAVVLLTQALWGAAGACDWRIDIHTEQTTAAIALRDVEGCEA